MKASRFLVSTLKEAPADAEVKSHQLMMRAGMIKRLGAGIYTYMPMGLRVIRRSRRSIREEMNRAGAVELLMPVVQPAELWQESGRWTKMGPEMLRVKDRHQRDFIIQPTSEEVVTDIARQELRSWRQLPKNFYHIQTKFRDERRPRFGIMRGREFTMKDAYSFDRDAAAAALSYDVMYAAYVRIFAAPRPDVPRRRRRHRRHRRRPLARVPGHRRHRRGRHRLLPGERLRGQHRTGRGARPGRTARRPGRSRWRRRRRPARSTCGDVAELLGLPLTRTVKSLVLATDGATSTARWSRRTVWLLLVRGDHDLNEIKAGKLAGLKEGFRFATAAEIESAFGCRPGYLGPIGLPTLGEGRRRPQRRRDERLRLRRQRGRLPLHRRRTGAATCPSPTWWPTSATSSRATRRPTAKARSPSSAASRSATCSTSAPSTRSRCTATYLDENGKPQLLEMGCYGIGVTRLAGRGDRAEPRRARHRLARCRWRRSRSSSARSATTARPRCKAAADRLHDELEAAGVDVMLDDRGERPGAMFADWELIGVPLRVVISDRGLKEGQLEVQGRRDAAAARVALADVLPVLKERLAA